MGQLLVMASSEQDEGGRPEDSFRRAAFNWALSTKRLVDASSGLGVNTKVAHAALVDIEHARDMLNGLFMPSAMKTPAGLDGETNRLTAEEVRGSVIDLASRVRKTPFNARVEPSIASQVQAHVDDIVGAPPIVRTPPERSEWKIDPLKPQNHRGVDLSAPVVSKNGKMLWATVDCPVCPSVASQRCQKNDGSFIEKPHPQRKTLAEAA